ncbi:MAG: GNAT family N-acetyltransferase [Gemmatimonadaceae bacterium]
MTVQLLRADSTARWGEARRLIEEYASSLNLDLSFQNFASEMEHLPTEYGPPKGAFLLAEESERVVGCVGLREFSENTGEIKRLYVVPAARGGGVGRVLAEGIVALGKQLGYTRLGLDTLPAMNEAQSLYLSLGFAPMQPIDSTPCQAQLSWNCCSDNYWRVMRSVM